MKCAFIKCDNTIAERDGIGRRRKYCSMKCRQKNFYYLHPVLVTQKNCKYYAKRREKINALSPTERLLWESVQRKKNQALYRRSQEEKKAYSARYYKINKKKVLAKAKAKREQRKKEN